METFDNGDLVRCTGTFTDLDGAPLDPGAVSFKTKDPSGTITTYNYPATIQKDSTGVYHVDIDADLNGQWRTRWQSTGTGQAAEESGFYVKSEIV